MTPHARLLSHSLLGASMTFAVLVNTTACSRPSVEQVDTNAAVPVVVETAKIDTLRGVVAASGVVSVAPGTEMIVVAPAPGRVAEISAAEGDTVKAGDVLVRFDIPNLTADVAARRAAVTQALARAEQDRANFARLSGLFAQGVAAQRDVEDAKRQQAEADADVEQARIAVDSAVALADRAVVRATFTGVVAKRFHNPGDLVDSASTDPILKVIDPTRVQVTATVAGADLSRVAIGHAAQIRVPGRDGLEEATVVAKSPRIDPGSITGDVRLAFRKPTTLTAGVAVQVEIVAEEHRDALIIPSAALASEDDELYVMVVGSDNKAHRFPVAVGLVARGLAQITSGIKAGDNVIVRGQEGLPEGAAVVVGAP